MLMNLKEAMASELLNKPTGYTMKDLMIDLGIPVTKPVAFILSLICIKTPWKIDYKPKSQIHWR